MQNGTFADLEARLIALKRAVEADSSGSARHPDQATMPEWQGAKTVVTADFTYEYEGFSSRLVVRTRHAESLSWLIFELQDAFKGLLDAGNKYGFYERLAQNALNHLAAHQPEAEDHRPLLQAVLSAGFDYLGLLRQYGEIPPTPPISLVGMDAEGRQTRLYLDPANGEESDPE